MAPLVATGSKKVLDGNMLIAQALSKIGVEVMFGVVGIPVTSVATYAMKQGIRFVAFRNEQSAGYAAGAFGYLTGKPGVLLTVSGPGCVHGLAGLSNAMINTWPLVMISGSCTQADVGKGDFQELDQLEAVKPFSKCSIKAMTISQIPGAVAKAFSAAVHGRPGGCYIDFPADVLHETISIEEAQELLKSIEPCIPTWSKNVADQQIQSSEIDNVIELLKGAKRPLIVFGKGAAFAHAEQELIELVEITGIPFLATPMAKGLIPDNHKFSATAARSLVLRESDVVLVVGARLNWLLNFGKPPQWSKDVKFIQIDISEEEIKLRKPAIGLVGDARSIVHQLNVKLKTCPLHLEADHPWLEKIRNKSEDNITKMSASLSRDVYPLNFLTPLRIIRDEISALGSPAPIIVSEGANTMDIGRAVLLQTEPRTRLDAGTWGTMGVGLGYAIAAAFAKPEHLVIAVEGDSGFGFSGFELETVVRYNLKVVIIIFNNDGVYGGDRRIPEDIEGPLRDFPAPTSFIPCARHDKVMTAFGGNGYFVSTAEEVQAAVHEAFVQKVPAVINIRIDPYAGSESGRMHHKN